VTFTSEVTAPVTVEILEATRETPGRYDDAPERCIPNTPGLVDVLVTLGGVDVTMALPADVLEALRDEALERLADP